MRLCHTDSPKAAAVRRSSVPLCAATRSASGPGRRIASNEIVALYVTALIYILFDLFVFHWLSGWLTALFECVEMAPIIIGAWFYWTTRTAHGGRTIDLPKILYVPVMSTAIQLQILLFAGIYGHVGLT